MTIELLTPFCWSLTCSLLIGATALLRLPLSGKLPRTIWPLLWWLVLLRLLLPVSLPCPVSVQNLWAAQPTISLTNAAYYGTAYFNSSNLPESYLAETEPAANTQPPASTPPSNIWLTVWGAGTCLSAAYFGLAYWHNRRRFRLAEPLEQPEIQQWLNQHQLRRPIAVRQSAEVASPLTYGLLRPVILLPTELCPQPAALHFALLHEWTHIRRFDSAAKLLAAAALCLHWFNPAVWLFFWLFSRDIELACDESVVRRCGGTIQARRSYALALLSWTETRRQNPLCNSFGAAPDNDKNVITERIVAIMNVKKVSYISLVLAGLLLVFTATAFATNSPEQQIADDIDESDIIAFDYYSIVEGGDSDEVLYTLQNMTEQLAPYEPFGLTWTFDDQDMDGQGLKMYYQGREVRGIYDDTTGSWFTEHAGCIGFAPDAVELFTVYTDGQLSGLRFATAEEQAQFDETRRQSSRQLTAEYEPFGVELNEQGQLVYNGQLVRYFWDGFEIWEDNELIGRAIHFEYTNPQNGEIDLRTIRGVSYNLDGSTNGFGQLQGVKVYVEPDVAAMQTPPSQQTAIAVYTADSLSTQGKTISEIMSEYTEFGLEYQEDVTSNGVNGNIYFNGELVTAFIDQKPDGQRTFSVQSYPQQDGADAVVLTEYDEQGRLIGLRRASREEANAYLAEHRLKSTGLRPGDDENSKSTAYSQQTAAQS